MRNEIDYNGQTFSDDTMTQGVMIQTESLDLRNLSVNQLNVTVESADDLTIFAQNTPAVFRHRGIQRGTVFIQTVEQVERTFYTLSTFSSLGRLLQFEHRGGIYNGVRADVLMADICGAIPFRMEAVFASTLVYGYLPIQQARLSLMQLLFALNANLRTDEDGVLVVQNLPTAAQSILDADKVYRDNARVVKLAPVTAVTVLEHQYVALASTEAEVLFEGTTVAGQTITFREPMYDLAADGFTISDSGANYAVVSAGTGTLTGKPYTHLTREITRQVSTVPAENIERIEDATLVGLTASADVVARLAEYYSHREWIYEDVITTYEDPGDVLSLFHPYKLLQVLACMASATTVLSTVLKSSIAALVGFTPWQVVPFEDVRVVLTGSGTWTVPEGVTSVTAVLISGAEGGLPGNKGGGPTVSSVNETQYSFGHVSAYWKKITSDTVTPGRGGQPGQPGRGGRILRVDIPVTSGQVITFSCGVGGLGTRFGSDVPNLGTDTVFGSYSTADGATSDTGFTDPVTGEVYAALGDQGIAGGDGASIAEPSPAGITVDGVTYNPGSQPSGAVRRTYQPVSTSSFVLGAGADGTMGGGAAYKANGNNGILPEQATIGTFTQRASTNWTATLNVPVGGTGANALPPPKATTIGKGGTSGNGGGGGGTPGPAFSGYEPASGYSCTLEHNVSDAVLDNGGDGSDGGEGADGGTILYCRRTITT